MLRRDWRSRLAWIVQMLKASWHRYRYIRVQAVLKFFTIDGIYRIIMISERYQPMVHMLAVICYITVMLGILVLQLHDLRRSVLKIGNNSDRIIIK